MFDFKRWAFAYLHKFNRFSNVYQGWYWHEKDVIEAFVHNRSYMFISQLDLTFSCSTITIQQVKLFQMKNLPGEHQFVYKKNHPLQFFHILIASSKCLILQILCSLELNLHNTKFLPICNCWDYSNIHNAIKNNNPGTIWDICMWVLKYVITVFLI